MYSRHFWCFQLCLAVLHRIWCSSEGNVWLYGYFMISFTVCVSLWHHTVFVIGASPVFAPIDESLLAALDIVFFGLIVDCCNTNCSLCDYDLQMTICWIVSLFLTTCSLSVHCAGIMFIRLLINSFGMAAGKYDQFLSELHLFYIVRYLLSLVLFSPGCRWSVWWKCGDCIVLFVHVIFEVDPDFSVFGK